MKSGKLAYMLNAAVGSEVFYQNIGSDEFPVADSSHKSVKLVDGKYINEAAPDKPDNPPTGDTAAAVAVCAVLMLGTAAVVAVGKKRIAD